MSEQLRPDEETALERAVGLGYLVASGWRIRIWQTHKAACAERREPFIAVQFGRKWATITLDLITCRRKLPTETIRQLKVAMREASEFPAGARLSWEGSRGESRHVPHDRAESLAARLVAIVEEGRADLWTTARKVAV